MPALAQKTAADGIVFALEFKLAATILKTLLLAGWDQVGLFVVVLAIRTIVKKQMEWVDQRTFPSH